MNKSKKPHRKPLNKDHRKNHAPGRGGDKTHPDTPPLKVLKPL